MIDIFSFFIGAAACYVANCVAGVYYITRNAKTVKEAIDIAAKEFKND